MRPHLRPEGSAKVRQARHGARLAMSGLAKPSMANPGPRERGGLIVSKQHPDHPERVSVWCPL